MALEVTRYIHMITGVTFTGLQVSSYYYLSSSLNTKNTSLIQYALRQSLCLDYPLAIGIIVIYATCFIMVWHKDERSYTEPWIQAACILLTVVSTFFFLLIYIKKINLASPIPFRGYKSMHFFYIGTIATLALIIHDAVLQSTLFPGGLL